MMPKEVLTDRAIRAEVVPGLSLRRICQLLNRFLPDDFAPDPLPPGRGLCLPIYCIAHSGKVLVTCTPILKLYGWEGEHLLSEMLSAHLPAPEPLQTPSLQVRDFACHHVRLAHLIAGKCCFSLSECSRSPASGQGPLLAYLTCARLNLVLSSLACRM